MDARPHRSSSPILPSARSILDQSELRSVLTHLSHEMCRPLVSLRAGFDLLLGEATRPVSADQRKHLQTMLLVCDDLLRLTRSYLDYASLAQGGRPLHYGSYTLDAVIRDIDREFKALAAARSLTWECRLSGDDSSVVTDASRCQQIFGNLVANAVKFTPPGGSVRVTGKHEGHAWFVTVLDSGPGIPAEACARVFEPFYRLPREEAAKIEGNGLGLAICRELVEQLGGEIELGSQVGRGTRVTVRFPVRSQSEPMRVLGRH
jgi:signal transduction histidine kinase